MSPQYKKAISASIKTIILGCAFAYIVHKLNHNTNLENFNRLIKNLPSVRVKVVIVVVFLLMFLNWFLEALKWKFLLKKIEIISTWKAVESVFSGLTWGVFTPNRIGEYGGRVFFLSPRKRLYGTIAMSVGALGLIVVTNILGWIGVMWFINKFLTLNFWLHFAIVTMVIINCSIMLFFFFNIRLLNNLLKGFKFIRRFHKVFKVFTRYKKMDLLWVFLYGLARFAVFTTQYCLVILLFVPDLAVLDIVLMLLVVFLVQSAIPSLDLFDIGIRSMTSTFFFSYITNQDLAIMASTAFIWLVNLIIPAILGSVFVLKIRFFDTNA